MWRAEAVFRYSPYYPKQLNTGNGASGLRYAHCGRYCSVVESLLIRLQPRSEIRGAWPRCRLLRPHGENEGGRDSREEPAEILGKEGQRAPRHLAPRMGYLGDGCRMRGEDGVDDLPRREPQEETSPAALIKFQSQQGVKTENSRTNTVHDRPPCPYETHAPPIPVTRSQGRSHADLVIPLLGQLLTP